jgi:hypothetical protein
MVVNSHEPPRAGAPLPHARAVDALAAELEVRLDTGLSVGQVRRRNVQYRPNQLPAALPRPAWRHRSCFSKKVASWSSRCLHACARARA